MPAPVIDGYRPPSSSWGPGNRGWEFATVRGEPVRSVGFGVVSFAGSVAGRGVVSVDHGNGLVSSLTGLAVVGVAEGDRVAEGSPLGRAAGSLHLGFRLHGRYVDPGDYLAHRRHAVLVSLPGE